MALKLDPLSPDKIMKLEVVISHREQLNEPLHEVLASNIAVTLARPRFVGTIRWSHTKAGSLIQKCGRPPFCMSVHATA